MEQCFVSKNGLRVTGCLYLKRLSYSSHWCNVDTIADMTDLLSGTNWLLKTVIPGRMMGIRCLTTDPLSVVITVYCLTCRSIHAIYHDIPLDNPGWNFESLSLTEKFWQTIFMLRINNRKIHLIFNT